MEETPGILSLRRLEDIAAGLLAAWAFGDRSPKWTALLVVAILVMAAIFIRRLTGRIHTKRETRRRRVACRARFSLRRRNELWGNGFAARPPRRAKSRPSLTCSSRSLRRPNCSTTLRRTPAEPSRWTVILRPGRCARRASACGFAAVCGRSMTRRPTPRRSRAPVKRSSRRPSSSVRRWRRASAWPRPTARSGSTWPTRRGEEDPARRTQPPTPQRLTHRRPSPFSALSARRRKAENTPKMSPQLGRTAANPVFC